MPSSRNYGNLVEKEIVNEINGKRYKSLTPNMRTFLRSMFGVIGSLEKVKCTKCEDYIKPDIMVQIKNEKRYVSIKSGSATGVHSELIDTVVPYLRSCGVSNKSLKTLVLYQFGDGTLDGSGKVRKNYHDTYAWLEKDIKTFNEEVNADYEIVINILERFLFQGVKDDSPTVDYIYFGDANYGTAVSAGQIIKHLKNKGYNFYENIHIGPLLIRPHAKYANTEIKNEYSRRRVDFYWPNLKSDIEYISKRYNNADY